MVMQREGGFKLKSYRLWCWLLWVWRKRLQRLQIPRLNVYRNGNIIIPQTFFGTILSAYDVGDEMRFERGGGSMTAMLYSLLDQANPFDTTHIEKRQKKEKRQSSREQRTIPPP